MADPQDGNADQNNDGSKPPEGTQPPQPPEGDDNGGAEVVDRRERSTSGLNADMHGADELSGFLCGP